MEHPQGPRTGIYIGYESNRVAIRHRFGNTSGANKVVPNFGNIHPLSFGHLIHEMGRAVDPTRRLEQLRLYRGMPIAPNSPAILVASSQRQLESWEGQSGLEVYTHPFRYTRAYNPDGSTYWKGEERGVSVKLAVDAVTSIFTDQIDVLIIAAAYGDLVPVARAALDAGVRVETAGWVGPDEGWSPLTVLGRKLWHHVLTEDHFNQVRDDTDYSRPPHQ